MPASSSLDFVLDLIVRLSHACHLFLFIRLVHCALLQYTQKSYGQRACSNSAPILWDNLFKAIRNSESALFFKSALKTYLFQLHN